MPLPLQKMREILFLLLYCHDFAECTEEDSTALVMRELEVAKRYMLEAQAQKKLVVEKMGTIDGLISQAAASYEFQRIPHIERNILRLGVYELFYAPGLPAKVAIAEAVRLSRKFASPESASFVNAVLDAIYRSNMEGPEKHAESSLCSVRAE